MKRTDSSTGLYKKPKLPRKRKKAAIKAQGREWYMNTIKLYHITQAFLRKDLGVNERNPEPTCKFWDNSSIKPRVILTSRGEPIQIDVPTKFW